MLSWVHDDETIRSEGARWALEFTSLAPDWMCPMILDGLVRLISGRFEEVQKEVNLSEETRRKIISSEPFRNLFNWTGSRWPWRADPAIFSEKCLQRDLMKIQALRFAGLPANYFDMDQPVDPAQEPNQRVSPSPSVSFLPLPIHEGALPSVGQLRELPGYDAFLLWWHHLTVFKGLLK